MGFILGKNFMLYIKRDGVKVPVCYAENVTLSFAGELLEATKALTTFWRSFYIGMLDYSIDCNGVVFDDETTTYNQGNMLDSFMRRENVEWVCQDDSNPLVLYSGSIVYPSLNIDSAAGDINRFTLSAKGDGDFVKTVIIPGASGNIYYGTQDSSEDPTDFTSFIQGDPNADIIIPYGPGLDGVFYWTAFTKGAQTKNAWQDQNNLQNQGNIGGDNDLFEIREIQIGGNPFWLVMTRYETGFSGTSQSVKYYIAPGTPQLEPPSNLVVSFENEDDLTAFIDFSFDPSPDLTVTGYQLRIINVSNPDTDYYDLGDTETSGSVLVNRGANYLISVRALAGNVASIWIADVTLNIPSAAAIETIIFTISQVEGPVPNKITVVSATGVVNTDVLVTYEYGVSSTSTITMLSGTSSVTRVEPARISPRVIALSPTSFGNQNYIF